MSKVCVVAYHPIVVKGICEIIKEKSPQSSIIATATDVQSFLQLLKVHKPDSAVIDVSVTWKNKVDLIEEVNRVHPKIKLNFISIHPFDHSVKDYLLSQENKRLNSPLHDKFIPDLTTSDPPFISTSKGELSHS